jgi:hypothetical protein
MSSISSHNNLHSGLTGPSGASVEDDTFAAESSTCEVMAQSGAIVTFGPKPMVSSAVKTCGFRTRRETGHRGTTRVHPYVTRTRVGRCVQVFKRSTHQCVCRALTTGGARLGFALPSGWGCVECALPTTRFACHAWLISDRYDTYVFEATAYVSSAPRSECVDRRYMYRKDDPVETEVFFPVPELTGVSLAREPVRDYTRMTLHEG